MTNSYNSNLNLIAPFLLNKISLFKITISIKNLVWNVNKKSDLLLIPVYLK